MGWHLCRSIASSLPRRHPACRPVVSKQHWLSQSATRPSSCFVRLQRNYAVYGSITAPSEDGQQPPRFFIDAAAFPSCEGESAALHDSDAAHAVKALRLKVGDVVQLCDGCGRVTNAAITSIPRNKPVHVQAVAAPRTILWNNVKWIVAAPLAQLKGGRGDWLIEKCCELGAWAVLPLITQRSGGGTTGSPPADRWERVAMAAAKQCLRVHSMQLRHSTDMRDMLARVRSSRIALVAVPNAQPVLTVVAQHASRIAPMRNADAQHERREDGDDECLLCVGPEGDFTSDELAALTDAGAVPVGLGSLRLRVETAAVALLAAAMLSTPSLDALHSET